MKLAYIGNVGPGSAPHSTENEVRKALEHLGVAVVPLHEQRFDWTAGAVPADVDVVLWTHTHGFAPPKTHGHQTRFLDALRDRGLPTVSYHLDLWWGLSRQHQVAEEPFFRTDLVCTADGGHDAQWEAAGVNHVWFPPAVSELECVPGAPRDEYRSEIAFVGTWMPGYHPESTHRAQLVDWLRDTYGDRCAFWPKPGQPALRGEDLRDLYASVKVVVGDSCLAGQITHYSSDRVPETIGRGALLVHPHVEGVTDGTLYTDGEHLLCWPAGDWDALANTIDAALADDGMRQQVTTWGRNHVLWAHTYTVRMKQLIKLLHDRGHLDRPQGGILPPGLHLIGESGPEVITA